MDITESQEPADPIHGTRSGGWGLDNTDNDTFCAVCGIPAAALQIEKDKYNWCQSVVAIRPSSLQSGEDIKTSPRHLTRDRKTRRFDGGGEHLEILPLRDHKFYQWLLTYSHPVLYDPTMLFPWVGVHMKCFHLMQRLIEYRKDVMRLTPDNNIFGTEDESTRIPASLGEMYEGYQSRIYWKDGVVSEVLYYLEPLSTVSSSAAPVLQSGLDRLPVEIQKQIFGYLHPFTDPPAECTRNITPLTWEYLLFHGQILPWLWDLDEQESIATDQVHTSTTSVKNMRIDEREDGGAGAALVFSGNVEEDENLWDWELLVRQLARHDSFDFRATLECLPRALLNRHRIWRLLDEARKDDVGAKDTWMIIPQHVRDHA
ncbi:hypothetical protein TMatcc_007412 [Talaromyces marneffei ATCC 18224]